MLTFETRTEDGVLVLDLEGKIDGGPESRQIHDEVKRALQEGTNRILINMQRVPWLNSLGVGILIASFVSAKREDAILRMYGAAGRVEAVLNTNGVIPEIFEMYQSEQEALASFS